MSGRSPVRRWVWGLAWVLVFFAGTSARAQMPDMKQMSGIPRPVTDLPNGSVSVRVIRGDMSNNVANQPVEMTLGGKVTTVNTDAEGRAQFDNLPPGAPVKFATTVDGERLESQEFPAQSPGGVRLLLVATNPDEARKAAAQATAAPVAGEVTIAGESRIVIEPSDESVSIYYVLDIINPAKTPVTPARPFVFTMPADAVGTTVVQGSSPLASNKGREVTIAGPFPPGTTAVQVAADFPIVGGNVSIAQAFPVTFNEPVVIAKKVGDMRLSSPQIDRLQDTVAEGTAVIVGAGKTLAPGQPLTLAITGLPHHSSAPKNIALVLAALVVVIGGWAAMRTTEDADDRAAERKRLIARREKLLGDLVRLEQDHTRGKIDRPRYAARREELVLALEHVYGALDEDDAGPEPARRAGVAA